MMAWRVFIAASAAAVALVSAQDDSDSGAAEQSSNGIPDFRITYYATNTCSGDVFTSVQGQQGFFQNVPGNGPLAGYRVTCNADQKGGVMTVCRNRSNATVGTDCFSAIPFTNFQCVSVGSGPVGAQLRTVLGADSLAITCQAPTPVPPGFGRCAVTWFELPDCFFNPSSVSGGLDRTIVDVNAGLCQLAVGGGSYKVTPQGTDGSSVVSFCTDQKCASCNVNTPFSPAQCRNQEGSSGSQSVSVLCGTPPPPSPSPIPPSPSSSPVPSASHSPAPSASHSPAPSASNSPAPSASNSPAPSASNSPAPSASNSPAPSASNSPAPSASNSPAPSASNSPAPSASNSPAPSASNSPAPSASNSPAPSASNSPAPSASNSPGPSASNSPAPSASNSPAPSASNSPAPSASNSPAPSASYTPTTTPSPTTTSTPTPTSSPTPTFVPSASPEVSLGAPAPSPVCVHYKLVVKKDKHGQKVKVKHCIKYGQPSASPSAPASPAPGLVDTAIGEHTPSDQYLGVDHSNGVLYVPRLRASVPAHQDTSSSSSSSSSSGGADVGTGTDNSSSSSSSSSSGA